MHKFNKHQKGVAFLEVLIAVLVISIGFLATSKMQILGMRYNQSAFFKSQASIMAGDIADRMRSNLDGVRDGDYDAIDTANLPSDPGCMSSGCTPAELANLDVLQWGSNVTTVLPLGAGTVTRDGSIFEIQVAWSDLTLNDANTQSITIWLNP